MSILALPTAGPRISGGSPLYRLGDRVRVNCTSDSSHPAPDLKWFINGKLVSLGTMSRCLIRIMIVVKRYV